MFDLSGFSSFAYVEFDTELHVWLNSNQSNRRPDVQQYFPLQSKYSHICLKVLKYLESLRIFNYFMVKSVKYFSFQVEPEANYSPDSFVGIAEFKNEYMLVEVEDTTRQRSSYFLFLKWKVVKEHLALPLLQDRHLEFCHKSWLRKIRRTLQLRLCWK